jgi:hypothetical protein
MQTKLNKKQKTILKRYPEYSNYSELPSHVISDIKALGEFENFDKILSKYVETEFELREKALYG